MAEITLRATAGRGIGSSEARRLRREGQIPAVVYGHGMEAIAVAVSKRDLRTVLGTDAGSNAVLSLHIGGDRYLALAREIQRHPVRGTVSHIDFQVIDPDKAVVAEVPLHLVGDAVEVRHADWEIDQQLFVLVVRTRPDRIPTHLDVDISELKAGLSIRLGDLVLPDGVEAEGDPTLTVVTTHAGRAAKAGGAENPA